MSGAVYACGHWRRRDPLEGLNEPLRAALADAALGPLRRDGVLWRAPGAARAHHVATLIAGARRGLLACRCADDGGDPRWRLTRAGRAVVADIRRRAANRAFLEASA